MLWCGRVMSAVPVLMLVMSGVMKLAKTQQVVDGFVHFGFSPRDDRGPWCPRDPLHGGVPDSPDVDPWRDPW